MKNLLIKRGHGFTLIEVIVVIAIIGILSSIVLFSISQARANARDKARQVDLKNLQLAIELYREANGRYPMACRGEDEWSGNVEPASENSYACSAGELFITGLAPQFIPSLPSDPKAGSLGANDGYIYIVSPGGSGYKLLAWRSVERDVVGDGHQFQRCPSVCRSDTPPYTPTDQCTDLNNSAYPITYAVYAGDKTCF